MDFVGYLEGEEPTRSWKGRKTITMPRIMILQVFFKVKGGKNPGTLTNRCLTRWWVFVKSYFSGFKTFCILLSIYAWNFLGGRWVRQKHLRKGGKDPGWGSGQNGGAFHFLGQLWFLILDKLLKILAYRNQSIFFLAANNIVRLSQNEATPKFIGFTRISKICVVDWQKSSN